MRQHSKMLPHEITTPLFSAYQEFQVKIFALALPVVVGFFWPSISAADTYVGLRFESGRDISEDTLIATYGSRAEDSILVILQPMPPTVIDRTNVDPFTRAETYRNSAVVCHLQYYFGNLAPARVALNPDMGHTPNVVTFVLRDSATGDTTAFNTWARGMLPASQSHSDGLTISGYTATSQADTWGMDFASRAEAEAARWRACDLGGTSSIEVQAFSHFLGENIGVISPLEGVRVELYDNSAFVPHRAAQSAAPTTSTATATAGLPASKK